MAAAMRVAPLRLSVARSPAMSLTSSATKLPARASRFSTAACTANAWMQAHRNQAQTRPFHASAKRALLPAAPQTVHGGVNDPAPVPEPHPSHGSYHWVFERALSLGLVPLTIAPFAAGSLNPTMDALLCTTLLLHSHIGFQALIIDYLPSQRVPKTRALFNWGLRAATLLVGVGLYEFETNDVGLTEGIKRVWKA